MSTAPAIPANWKARFFTIWGGQAFSLLGSMLVQFSLIWYITSLTGSAAALAAASLIGLLPQVLIGPLAGALVDRWNRRLTMIIADSTVAGVTLILAVLFALGLAQLWHIYLAMFIRSVVGIFHYTAMQVSTSLMVPKEHLSRVQGFNSMLNGGLNIIAAPLGALLLEVMPLQVVLAIDVSTAFFAVTPLFFISVPQPVRQPAAPAVAGEQPARSSVWSEMLEGLRYVRTWPGLMMILGMALAINFLLTPASSLIPLLVQKHFSGGAPQYALAESLWGVGAIAGGLLLGVWGGFKRRIYTSMLGLAGLGVGSLLLGFAPAWAFPLGVVGMALLGLCNPITNGPLMAIIQASVDPEMQGRVFNLIGSAAAAMSPFGLILAAPVADNLGLQAWFIIGGVVTLLMALIGSFIPDIINLEHGHPTVRPAAPALDAVAAD